jgi:type I restriction enzyme R subunit
MSSYDEATFESAIEIYLSEHDKYIKRDHTQFDRKLCIDTEIFCEFIKQSQPKEWEYLEKIHKDKTSQILIDDLTRALDSEQEGCLSVLRHGFKCYGKMIHGAYFKPVTGMNPETQRLYESNKLTIVRQVRYSENHNNSIDVVLTVNGIPVVTMELKNPMTGQNYSHARTQYMVDRDPQDKIFQFKKRSLVNFAVDTDEVYMTTQLKKKGTFFLPFNKGWNHGKGNPENPEGYKTSYLWEEVLQSDSLLEIISRFLHLQIEEKKSGNKKIKKETMIFPRYHQLDVVRKLISTSRIEGPGNNYLIQHSAGSGKSNSIAWTAHRLASLHDENNNKVFSSVIVVTDRRVLDQQLQNTIYQFEHKDGVVKKIDQNSSQLADSLTSGTPIIITTLQKFPFVIQKVGDLKERTYAVVVDEAHSSMGGQTASEMKGVLGDQVEEENYEYESSEEEIIKEINKRGPQKNISFFAFTATPKYKTLEVFGREGVDGKPEPFHLYSMRQAIEEGFILDVLENYTTYKTYHKLIKSIEDDPTVDKKKASLALARFMSLHPHNISQKVEVIVEHFRTHTKHKMEGRAKAMVVTRSRLHAVRYKQSIDKYLKEHNYTDIGTLVAFSGTVDDDGIPFTEVRMNNGIKERELPEKFGTDDFSFLIVANKYQTGFDQPLLHSMYIDRTLGGIQAIQTLSRLNRICISPRKEDTFVLDFVNEPEEIQLAFQPYYEKTIVGERSEYGKLYELQNKLKGFNVYFEEEVNEFCRFFFSSKKRLNPKDHSQMNSILDKGVTRFIELDDTEKEDFRSTLVSFRNLYSFLSQIIPFSDTDLEKLYTYLKFLYTKLPRKDKSSILSLDDDVDLKYYRLQKISEGSIKLMVGEETPVYGPADAGGGQKELELEELSTIIDLVNDRFKTDFTKADELFFDSVREDAMNDEGVRDSAKVNTLDGFSYVFNKKIEDLFVDRMEQNEVLTSKFLNDRDFKKVVSEYLMKQVYDKIREEVGV